MKLQNHIKKLLSIAIVIVLATMLSCTDKTAKSSDSVSASLADSAVATAPAELWTVEAVEAQVRKMYDRLNEMYKEGEIDVTKLEDEYCTSYYCGLRDAIYKAIEEVPAGDDMMLFGDEEGFRIFAGLGTPLVVESIKADLLTGNMAQAQVRFKGADEEKGFMRLELDMENGQWRVNNFDQPEAFGPGGYLKMMQDFASEHGISYEGIATHKGEDTAKEWDVSVRTTDLEEPEPRYEAIFRDENGKTIQVAEGHTVDYPQDMLKPFGNVWQADVNFDGYTDIMICLGMMPASDQVITYYDAWLYNPQTGKFNHHEGFRDIANPEVDNVNKHVIAHYLLRDGKNKHYTAFVLQNDGTQKLVKEWDRK